MRKLHDEIALPKTRLKLYHDGASVPTLEGYVLVRHVSTTSVGSVRMHIKYTFEFSFLDNINLNVESCEDFWIQVTPYKNPCALPPNYNK